MESVTGRQMERRQEPGTLQETVYLVKEGWESNRSGTLNLAELFSIYPALREAWYLKEGFRHWYRTATRTEAEIKLDALEQTIISGPLPEFKHLLPTLRKWRQEILNYFDYRITNGFVEGKNNRIKTIKRMAYGYRNLDNFRLRILANNFKG